MVKLWIGQVSLGLTGAPTLDSWPLVSPSIRVQKAQLSNGPFRHKIEDAFRPSVRGVCNWCSGETNALSFAAEFSRQRASSRSRIAMWGIFYLPSRSQGLRPGPISNQLKALGISVTTTEGATAGFEEGSPRVPR
jgi:hypothetical protein